MLRGGFSRADWMLEGAFRNGLEMINWGEWVNRCLGFEAALVPVFGPFLMVGSASSGAMCSVGRLRR